jgi:hypothetical protein
MSHGFVELQYLGFNDLYRAWYQHGIQQRRVVDMYVCDDVVEEGTISVISVISVRLVAALT